MAYLLPYCICTLYIDFSIMLLTVRLSIPCVCVVFCRTALSWPGRSCKLELVLNWPAWLNKGEIFLFFLNKNLWINYLLSAKCSNNL